MAGTAKPKVSATLTRKDVVSFIQYTDGQAACSVTVETRAYDGNGVLVGILASVTQPLDVSKVPSLDAAIAEATAAIVADPSTPFDAATTVRGKNG